ncbi:MAG: 50S ribosomal protein L39e [Nanoarchaeota archaeon]|nr:50S ribosomal protein L39e [Nanoarchaeota archaeon]
MTRNKVSSLKTKLVSAKRSYRVAPRWIVLRKYGGLKRSMHVSSWRVNPKMRRHWRKKKIKV